MSTQYLSYGIADGRSSADRDPALLRTVEIERAEARRASGGGVLRRRFLR